MATPEQIQANINAIRLAALRYGAVCGELVHAFEESKVPDPWQVVEIHGEHIRFENADTGQVVEAPEWGNHSFAYMDPGFFAMFVVSSNDYEIVRGLLWDDEFPGTGDFQTACQMIDALRTLENAATRSKA